MRSLAYLRTFSFPLLTLLGIGLLVLGWFEWRRFHDELYLEEMRAIGAAVDAGATVRYQRAGEAMERIATGPDHQDAKRYDLGDWPEGRTKAPANSPFLGRVEILCVDDHFYHPAFRPLTVEAGHALLTLPGLKSFAGAFGPSSGSDAKIEQALGFDLPKLPETELTKEDLLIPLPRGEKVDEATQAETIARIVESWSRDEAPRAYVVHARFRRRDSDEFEYDLVETIDGECVALQTISRNGKRDMGPQPPCKNGLRLYDGARMFRIDREPDSWRRVATYDRDGMPYYYSKTVGAWMPPPGSPPRFYADGRAIDHALYWLQQAWPDSMSLLGRQGENVAAIERLPSERWRIVLAPHRSTVVRSERETGASLSQSRTIEVEAVLRGDLGFAVEASRIVATLEDGSARHETKNYLIAKRRLAEVDGLGYSAECLDLRSTHVVDLQAPTEPDFTHSDVDRVQTSAIVVPSIRDAVFDPLSYDPTPWPEARELPFWRTYRIAWSLGGALFLVGVAGSLVGRRSDRPVPSESHAPERQPKARRLPRLRFGLTSMFAAALLLISAAGVVKEKRDEASQEIALLGRVSGHVYVERAEPQFPWSVFSTPTLPIDAPVRRVLIDDHWKKLSEELPEQSVRRLLELPELESFRYLRSERRKEPEDAFAFAKQALARPLPAPVEEWNHLYDPEAGIPYSHRESARFFGRPSRSEAGVDAMADGTTLPEAERDAYVAQLTERWAQAAGAFPNRYLMAVDPHTDPGHVSVTLRDGERYWSAADARDVRDASDKFLVRCQDDRYRYAYAPAEKGAVLVERSRLGVPHLLNVDDKVGAESLGVRMQDRDYLWNVEFAANRAPVPPFAFPRVLDRAEFPDDLAAAAIDTKKIRRVARVSDLRHRLEFDPTTIEYGSDGVDRIELSELVVIVRDDLDGAVASVELHRAVTLSPEENREPDRRFFRIENVLTRSPEGVVVPERTFVFSDERRNWMSLRSDTRVAYDFAPAIDPRIFSSPSMSELDPLPEPKPRPSFAWWMATGSVAIVLFAIAAIGNLRRAVGRQAGIV